MADWSGAAAYARSFQRLCAGAVDPLLGLLGSPAGGLLDVGSGPGTVAVRAAELGWRVTAVEPDPAMRAVAAQAGITALAGGLPDLPVPDGAVAAAVANFVVNHLPDPRAGARGLARVVEPGGGVAASIWPARASALPEVWDAVIQEARAIRPPGTRLDPALDFARTAEGLAGLFADAGLVEITTRTVEFDFTVAPEDLWSAVEAGIGVVGTTWRAADAATKWRMRAAYDRIAEDRAEAGALRFPAQAILASARRPRSC